jgi:DNA-binding MarR family transcriptional regulator
MPKPPELRDLLYLTALAAERYRVLLARRLDLRDTEFTALEHLARSPLSPGQLARLILLTSGGMTALLHRLAGAGHVRRERHPGDRRSFVLHASPEILKRRRELNGPLAESLDAVSAARSPEEREVIGRYLEDVLAVMAAHTEVKNEPEPEPVRVHPGLWA